MSNEEYESYGDWYDNGPGSENFKRQIRQSNLEFLKKSPFPMLIGQKRLKTKKNGKNILEMADALDRRIKATPNPDDSPKMIKHNPTVEVPRYLLDELVKSSRRLLRYVKELEK